LFVLRAVLDLAFDFFLLRFAALRDLDDFFAFFASGLVDKTESQEVNISKSAMQLHRPSGHRAAEQRDEVASSHVGPPRPESVYRTFSESLTSLMTGLNCSEAQPWCQAAGAAFPGKCHVFW
jgi:hypothetical protein